MPDEPRPLADVLRALADSKRQPGSTTTSPASPAPRAFRFRREPSKVYFPWKPRELEQVPLAVRQAIKRCATGESPWPLVLTGDAGVGKTCAALCLLDYSRGLYFTAASLCEALIQSMKGDLLSPLGRRPISPMMLWQEIEECYLLVVDELGLRTSVRDHHYESVKRAIDAREGRPACFISNLPLPELLSVYDDRIVSRLAGGTVVPVFGPDRRMVQ